MNDRIRDPWELIISFKRVMILIKYNSNYTVFYGLLFSWRVGYDNILNNTPRPNNVHSKYFPKNVDWPKCAHWKIWNLDWEFGSTQEMLSNHSFTDATILIRCNKPLFRSPAESFQFWIKHKNDRDLAPPFTFSIFDKKYTFEKTSMNITICTQYISNLKYKL